MSIISINKNSCKKCGLCSIICVDDALKKTKQGEFPEVANEGLCTNCGHCVAICPNGAISNSKLRPEKFIGINPKLEFDTLRDFIRSKRSIRYYKDTPVEKQKIEKLLELAQQAPSDLNCQARRYIVVTDRKKIDDMEKLVVNYYRTLLFWMKYPVRKFCQLIMPGKIKTLEAVSHIFRAMINKYDNGEKPVFRNAPCVILIVGNKLDIMNMPHTIIPQDYMMLGAEAMGLGSCMASYVVGAPGALVKYLGIKKNECINCAFIIGNPKYKITKAVDRKNAEVQWL